MRSDSAIEYRATVADIDDRAAHERAARLEFGAPSAVWRHDDAELIGFGVAYRLEFSGPDRMREAAAAWRELSAAIAPDAPGATPIAFGAFTFADRSAAASVLIVPRRVIVVRDGVTRQIDVAAPADATTPGSAATAGSGAGGDAVFGAEDFERAVGSATARIRSGALDKVVLARDLALTAPAFELEVALGFLADRYRGSWVFAVDGLFGASPETLVAVADGQAVSRVLAGTSVREDDAAADAASCRALLESAKDRLEHTLAVDSLVTALRSEVDDLDVGAPYALALPNVWHLATDASARVRPGTGALDLISLLHPTAAVAGTPRLEATRLIDELEPFDRRRYAGPVGWVDGNGDGEWAIALRAAETEGPGRVRTYAGGGIVESSDPHSELIETEWKFRPIRDAFAAASFSP